MGRGKSEKSHHTKQWSCNEFADYIIQADVPVTLNILDTIHMKYMVCAVRLWPVQTLIFMSMSQTHGANPARINTNAVLAWVLPIEPCSAFRPVNN